MRLSILLRNLNEGDYLLQFLPSLRRQITYSSFEIVVVDNSSNDHSLEVIQQYNCKLVRLARNEFTYGGSLNKGIANCNGDIIFIVSPHICLKNNDFLQKTIEYFDSNDKVAGLRFINLGQPDTSKNCFEEYNILTYIRTLDFFEKNNSNFIVNHCSAIRKSCWDLVKFDASLIACEDKKWSLEILQKGFCILYNIPLVYSYKKQYNAEDKATKFARELAAFEQINGIKHRSFHHGFAKAVFFLLKTELWRLKNKILNFRLVYKKLQQLRQTQ